MPVSDYTPSLTDVGATTLSRTVDDVGNVTGTFSAETSPTDTQVNLIIPSATDDVARKIGTDIPADLRNDAKRVAALRTAMLIELNMFGVEVATDRSPYPQIKTLYDELLADLQSAVAAEEAGQSPTNELDGNMPSFNFPPATDWLNRRM